MQPYVYILHPIARVCIRVRWLARAEEKSMGLVFTSKSGGFTHSLDACDRGDFFT
jgi:hypothetical protein